MTTDTARQIARTRRPFEDAKAEAILQIVQDYWDQLRVGSTIPLRSDIAPNALYDALPYCFIAERVAPEIARFRVAGQALHDILGMEARGMPISAFLTPEAREMLGPLVEAAFTSPRIVEIALQTERSMTRAAVHARLIIMPLRNADHRVSRLLGAIVTDRPVRLGSRRFGLSVDPVVQDRVLRVSSGKVRLIATADSDTPDPKPAPSSPLANPPKMLRLVVDNT